ncbi:MAG: hypothetical protein OEZ36_02565 [Spirochaetota bacterium]|nr:hypothetical protein [Spirochaetota bacterium]
MAILLEGCDGAPVIWGRLGEFIIQRTSRGRMVIRRYKQPANPRTELQQLNRNAFREGLSRWTLHEKSHRKAYWDDVAAKKGFRDGYRAFMSSFMMIYQRKVRELGGVSQGLLWVTNTTNTLSYEESPSRIDREKRNELMISKVMKWRESWLFHHQLKSSLDYLSGRGWLGRMRYNLLPQADSSKEWEILSLGLLGGG